MDQNECKHGFPMRYWDKHGSKCLSCGQIFLHTVESPLEDITAKELFDKMLEENSECTSTEMMIRFAEIKVLLALKTAANVATTQCDYEEFLEGEETWIVNKESILNAYPLTNIK